ncbi:MAG: hypothetical protein WDA02_09200 [Saccharofermentanales bacterium]
MARFRTIPYSLRRRTLITSLVTLLVIALFVLPLALQIASRRRSGQATLIRLNDQADSQLVLAGTGVNLTGMPAANLVTGGAFSPQIEHDHFFASGGTQDEFHIKMSEARSQVPLARDYYTGASFSLYRETMTEMKLISQGRIAGYDTGVVSGKRALDLPSSYADVRWTAFTQLDGSVFLCGTSGALLRIPKGGDPEAVSFRFDVDLTAIAAGPAGLLAGDSGGNLYASATGSSWNLITSVSPGNAIRSIQYIDLPDYENGFYLASGGPGELFFGHPSGMEPLSFPLEDQVTAIVRSGDGIIYALGNLGGAASSVNGIQWQVEASLEAEKGWLAAQAGGGLTCFAGQDGQLALRTDKGAIRLVEDGTNVFSSSDLSQIMVMSSSKLLVLSPEGRLFHSRDGGRTWNRENPLEETRIDRFRLFPSGDLYMTRRDGTVLSAELTAQFRFQPALEGGSVIPGDLLTISQPVFTSLDTGKASNTPSDEAIAVGEWAISGGAAFEISSDAAKGREGYDSGGACALSLTSEGAGQVGEGLSATPSKDMLYSIRSGVMTASPINNPDRSYLSARLTQKLDLSRLIDKDTLPFYRLEFDIRIKGAVQGPVEVWFSGSIPQVGESVRLQGDAWQHRRLTLLFPRGLKPEDELYINFGFQGEGTLFLDNVWFGRNEDAPGALSSLLTDLPESLSADVIRLEAVPVGRSGFREEFWCLPEGTGHAGGQDRSAHNLGAALGFVESQGALPWLVVDLHATDKELAHLIEYLAGSPLSVYGKLRSRDGAIGRWTDAFGLLYIEIRDGGRILPNDASRANYVHWIMDRIKAAPDFAAVKNQIFFIDGMHYDDGRSHTTADYHAGDFSLDQPILSEEILETVRNEWINRIPRRGMSGGLIVPELIRTLEITYEDEPARLADTAACLLMDLGTNTALALMDVNLASRTYLSGKHLTSYSLEAVRGLSGLQLLQKPSLIRSGTGAQQETDADQTGDSTLFFQAYGSRDRRVFFALNFGRYAHVLSIQGLDHGRQLAYELYDHRGTLISQGVPDRRRDDFTLLPGGLLVIREEAGRTP